MPERDRSYVHQIVQRPSPQISLHTFDWPHTGEGRGLLEDCSPIVSRKVENELLKNLMRGDADILDSSACTHYIHFDQSHKEKPISIDEDMFMVLNQLPSWANQELVPITQGVFP
jgi:hypothetical protein